MCVAAFLSSVVLLPGTGVCASQLREWEEAGANGTRTGVETALILCSRGSSDARGRACLCLCGLCVSDLTWFGPDDRDDGGQDDEPVASAAMSGTSRGANFAPIIAAPVRLNVQRDVCHTC